MNNNDWTLVGRVMVDAGIIMIGDPCYTLPTDSAVREKVIPGGDWSRFCAKLNSNNGAVTTFGGLAIVTPTGYGDGEYNVYVKRNIEGRVAEIKVVFIDENADDIDDLNDLYAPA